MDKRERLRLPWGKGVRQRQGCRVTDRFVPSEGNKELSGLLNGRGSFSSASLSLTKNAAEQRKSDDGGP
jgi:hypothetical protein